MSATRRLAEFIYGLRYDDISRDAISKAKLCLMDWVGVTVGGYASGQNDMDAMIDALSPFFGQPQATLITKKRKVDVVNAALINGTASHFLDYDDVHMGMIGHPTVPVVPAALAVGEYHGIDGKKLIEAIVVGIEVECRIGEAVNPEHYATGWHATATLGGFGACAAVAKIIGLNVDKVVSALGIAGTQAFGLQQSFGTMCKPFHAGKAASNGIIAAFLAQKGFTAPQQILEGQAGFGKAFSQKFDDSKIGNFGRPFEIEGVVYKRYASCYLTHAAVRCMLEMRERYHPTTSEIDSIEVKASSAAVAVAGKPEPQTGLEGKFSLRYCVALALLKGRAVESDFADNSVHEPAIKHLMSKVNVIPEESSAPTEVEINIEMNDGGEIKERLELTSKDAAVPISEWQSTLEAKSSDLLKRTLTSETTNKIITGIQKLDKTDNIKNIVELLS
ncbi:MAG: MmgE/PrpD family protein [Chloroflexi bacterium]|nr:MmgE/PrpD family protein [Chloroflexota bacterium]